jgi:ParB/RepB/Spo0J family partition protein
MILVELDQQEIAEPAAPIRAAIDEEGLDELAASIADIGLLQPPSVKRVGDRYEIIAGHRRLLATRKLGLPKICCIVVDDDDGDILISGRVHENLVRRDITPVEEATFYAELMEKYHDVEEVCRVTHRTRGVVESRLLLLTGDRKVLEALSDGLIGLGVAMELNHEPSERKRRWFLEFAIKDGATVRTIDQWRRSHEYVNLDELNLETAPAVTPDGKEAVRSGPFCYLCGGDDKQHEMRWHVVHESCDAVAHRLGWQIHAEVGQDAQSK